MRVEVETDTGQVRRRAESLLAAGAVGDAYVREHGRLEEPLSVCERGGGPHSWFVGVSAGDRLVGFLQLDRRLGLLRYSSFGREPSSSQGSPPRSDWLDPERIRRRAAENLGPGEAAGDPYLTFDVNPSRLVWAVPVVGADDGREIFVAGETVYEPSTGGLAFG
jgi:hypothetical protein